MPELPAGNPLFESEAPASTSDDGTDDTASGAPEAPPSEPTDDPGEGEPAGDLFAEKPVSPAAFKKRLGKLIEQREAAREDATGLRERLARLEGESSAMAEFKAKFDARYGDFKDPAKQLEWDASFLQAAEALSKDNPEVARAVAAIQKQMGGTPMTEKRETTVAPKDDGKPAEKPAEDPRVQKLLERDARRTVQDALKSADVKPAFAKLIADHVVNHAEDLSDLDGEAAMALARTFVKESGFSPEEILATPPKKAAAKPKTAGTARAATGAPRNEKGEEKTPEAPKSLDEWQQRRAERLAAFGAEE